MKTCAILPAAGLGLRIGQSVPKILLELAPNVTVFDALYRRLSPYVDHVQLVLSAEGKILFEQRYQSLLKSAQISIVVQPKPLGMGDAVFTGWDIVSYFDRALVVWGDQASLSEATICQTILGQKRDPVISLPLIELDRPYVNYIFADEDSRTNLIRVEQSREGEVVTGSGFSDVGVFGLPALPLLELWNEYLVNDPQSVGKVTKEKNFLPFLPFLCREKNWKVRPVKVTNVSETRGINAPQDLAFFRAKELTDI